MQSQKLVNERRRYHSLQNILTSWSCSAEILQCVCSFPLKSRNKKSFYCNSMTFIYYAILCLPVLLTVEIHPENAWHVWFLVNGYLFCNNDEDGLRSLVLVRSASSFVLKYRRLHVQCCLCCITVMLIKEVVTAHF